MTPQLLNNSQESEVSGMKANWRKVFFFFSLAEMTEKARTQHQSSTIHIPRKQQQIVNDESTQLKLRVYPSKFSSSHYYVVCVTAG